MRICMEVSREFNHASRTTRNPSPHYPASRRTRQGTHSGASQLPFEIDVLVCPRCAGRRTLLAAIHDPDSIRRVLGSLGLSAELPVLGSGAGAAGEVDVW